VLAKGVVVVPSPSLLSGPWLSATRASALQRVGNRPIVWHVLSALQEAGVSDVAIVSPPDVAQEIAACVHAEGSPGIEVHSLAVEQPEEGGRPWQVIADWVGDAPAIVHRADGLLGQELLPYAKLRHDESLDALLLVAARQSDAPPHLELVSSAGNGHARQPVPVSPATVGVCVLAPGALSHMPGQASAPGLNLGALASRLPRGGARTSVRTVRKWRHFDGDIRDLLDLNRTVLEALEAETTDNANSNHFEGQAAIHPTASVSSSVIVGPVIVGAGAVIVDSYIGPHTSIAERVRIEGSELERSIVLADADVLHVGGRLVGSVVGRGARVFRDFSVPRALRLHVGDGAEVALC
jgi:glucose-1-phosphate thymidylyltransferase